MKKLLYLLIISTLLLSACTAPTAAPTASPTMAPTEAPKPANVELILATTTSTRDSGLLDVLLPLFQEKTGYNVKMVAVGSGQALKMGEEGNADVLLVHSPAAEKTLMDNGFGKERLLVMHNDFIIVGPKDDPAKIKGSATAVEAFKKIADAKATFVSRADDSGTHKMELSLWKSAGIEPAGDWYLQSGQGMGETLRITTEKAGYTLSDRATYLAQSSTLQLEVLVEGDKALLNIYHVITVNPDKWPKVNDAGAKAFADFLVSPEIQKVIEAFGKDKYGQSLFFPDAGKPE
ncbi:MAG TPA: substrate-binding domain-containing protein [Anaerolineaceae bacterium]|nr:substrate-binding domain-containing protein [Anaerolineaceae bacterium]HPN52796.1 substrate-binding domain-containing protein [Anaerolineaceae bacterium]